MLTDKYKKHRWELDTGFPPSLDCGKQWYAAEAQGNCIMSNETQSTPRRLGVTTLSNGDKKIAVEPSFGVIWDRINDDKNPPTVFTVPSLCINETEEWIRNLGLEDGAKILELCSPAQESLTRIAQRFQNASTPVPTIKQH